MPLKSNWGTPKAVIAAVTAFMGGIDLDPCSDEHFNRVVGASTFYADDGLTLPWFGRVWLNPPGGKSRVIPWWNRLVKAHEAGEVAEGCYLSFSLDTFQTTQSDKSAAPILGFPSIVFARRLRFLQFETLVEQKSPWKPCALTWLPPRHTDRSIADLATLLAAFGEPGMVVG